MLHTLFWQPDCRRVKNPKRTSSPGLIDIESPALGIDFARAMAHTPSPEKPLERLHLV